MPSRGVLPRQHRVIRRVAEDQVAASRFGGEAAADVVRTNIRTGRVEVVGEATATHRLADVERGSAAGHRVDDQGVGKRVVVKSMRNDCRRDRTGVGDTEGPVVPERPDVVRCWAKIGAEAIAATQVFVGRVDRLGPGVELRDAAPARTSPDWASRQMRALADTGLCPPFQAAVRSPYQSGPEPRSARAQPRCQFGPSSRLAIVGIPTIGAAPSIYLARFDLFAD